MKKVVYPVILTEITDKKTPYLVYVPDFDTQTQGGDIADAIFMAEDVISLMGITLSDDKKPIPKPSKVSDIDPSCSPWHKEKEALISIAL